MVTKRYDTKKLTVLALLTAIVVVLQFAGSFIRFGMFAICPVLIPIVIGAALYGPLAGAWLGLAFSLTVLISGDAAAFLAVDVFGTIVTVLVKGVGAGFGAGLAYKLLCKRAACVDIVGDVADDISRGVGVEIAYGQGGEVIKDLAAQGVDDLLPKAHHNDSQKVGKQSGKGIKDHQKTRVEVNGVEIHLSATCGKGVDGHTRQLGACQGQNIGGQHQHEGQQDRGLVAEQIFAHSPKHAALGGAALDLILPGRGKASGVAKAASAAHFHIIQGKHLPSANR